MGIEIVKSSIVHGKRLSGNAYKVLVVMSMSALDKPRDGRPAGLYWGGWDALAVALGCEDAARDSSGHVLVKRAVKELRDGGHISPMVTASRGTRQSYFVHPGGLGKGEQIVPVKGEQNVPLKGEQIVPQRGNKTFPPRKEQDSEGLTQDISIASVTAPQTAAGETSNEEIRPHKFKGEPSHDDCLACGQHYQNRKVHPIRLLRGA